MANKKDTNKKGTNNKTTKKNETKNNKKNTNKNLKNIKIESEKIDKQIKERLNENGEMKRLLKIVLIVTAIFAVFYGVTIIVTNKADEKKAELKDENTTVEEANIQYEYIMIGTMLNYKGTYYVLIEDADDPRLDEYESLVDSAKANEDASKIYKANLTDSFNKGYLAKEENYYVSDIADFAVKGTTLVKVVDGKIDSVKDKYNDIKNKLSDLS